jgi:hypothetical protein
MGAAKRDGPSVQRGHHASVIAFHDRFVRRLRMAILCRAAHRICSKLHTSLRKHGSVAIAGGPWRVPMTLKPDQMEHPLPSRPAIDNPMVMFRHHPLCWRSETDRFALVWDFGEQGRRGAFGNCGRGMPTIGTRKERHGRHTNSVSATKAEGLTSCYRDAHKA